MVTERADQARQRLTDRLYFLTKVPEGKTLVRVRTLEHELLSFISEAGRALCSNDDGFLADLIDNVNSAADEIVSLARPLRQTYDLEGKSKEADDLKRRFDLLTVDRVNLVLNRSKERRLHLANSADLEVKLYMMGQDLCVMFDDANLASQNNDAEQIKKVISDIESLTDQVQTTTNTLMASNKRSGSFENANKIERLR